MQEIKAYGHFWWPNTQEQFTGHLIVEATGKIIVEINTTVNSGEFDDIFNTKRDYLRAAIRTFDNGEWVNYAFYKLFVTNTAQGYANFIRFEAQHAFQFEKKMHPSIDPVSVMMVSNERFDDWVVHTGFRVDPEETNSKRWTAKIRYEQPLPLELIDNEEFRISFLFTAKQAFLSKPRRVEIREKCYVRVEFKNPVKLELALHFKVQLGYLMSLLIGETICFDELEMKSNDVWCKMSDFRRKSVFFTHDEIAYKEVVDQLSTVFKVWLLMDANVRNLIETFILTLSNPSLSAGNVFASYVAAVESLHRLLYFSGKKSLRERIEETVSNYLDEENTEKKVLLLNSLDEIVDNRNYYAHLTNFKGKNLFSNEELGKINYALETCLLVIFRQLLQVK
jgi:ApeA N-terminal domain 1